MNKIDSALIIFLIVTLSSTAVFAWPEHGDWSLNELTSWDSRSNSFFPQMAIGPDGIIHVAWQDESNLSATCIEPYYSYRLPNSNSWSVRRWLFNESRNITTICADAYTPTIAVDSANNVYAVYMAHTNETDREWDQDLFMTERQDGIWLPHELITSESYWDDYNPKLAIGPGDTLHLVYSEYGNYSNNGWDYDVLYKQKPYGQNWTLAETVSTESTSDSTHPDVAVDSHGNTHVVWEDYTNYQGSCGDWDIFYKMRAANGVWGSTEIVSTETMCDDFDAYRPSIAIGPDDTVHVAWKDNAPYGGNNRTYVFKILAKEKPYGGSWTSSELVSTESTRDAQDPDVAVGQDGTEYIVYYDSTPYAGENEGTNDTDIMIKRRLPGVSNWTDLQMISWYNNSDSSLEPAIAVIGNRLHAVWEDSTDYGNPDASRDILYSTNQPGEQYTFTLDGSVHNSDGSAAQGINVTLTDEQPPYTIIWTQNLTTDADGHYSITLYPGLEIFLKDKINITARDHNHNIAMGGRKVVQDDYVSQHMTLPDQILDQHYTYLEGLPYYRANNRPYNDSGASAAQMALNYLMWDSTQYPEPPLTFPNQSRIFQQFNTGLGVDYLNPDEMARGMNLLINDSGNNWSYGYFYDVYNTSNQTQAFQQMLIWMDYPADYYNDQRAVDVPKLGHPYHAPVLFPYYNYYRWYVVKGIHTNLSAWPITESNPSIKIYGMWLVDAAKDPYFTEEYISYGDMLNFLLRISQSGDPYNNRYAIVTDPPRDIQTPMPNINIVPGEERATFSPDVMTMLTNGKMTRETQSAITDAAYSAAMDVMRLDERKQNFEEARSVGKPMMKDGGYVVNFTDGKLTYEVLIDPTDGHLRRIRVSLRLQKEMPQ